MLHNQFQAHQLKARQANNQPTLPFDNTTLSNNPFGPNPTLLPIAPPSSSSSPPPSQSTPAADQSSTNVPGSSTPPDPSPTPVSSTPSSTNNPDQTSLSSSSGTVNPTSTTPSQESTSSFPTNPQTSSPPPSSSPTATNDQSSSASFSSPPTSSTSSPSATAEPPPQSTSTIPEVITSASSVPPTTQSSPSFTFTSSAPAPSQDAQTAPTSSRTFGTTTDPDGAVHTYTTYVDVFPQTIQSSVLANGSRPANASSGLLNNGETREEGFFDHRGAVIGTFLTLGLVVLAGLVAILWRFARLRKRKLRAEGADPDINFDKLVANDLDEPDSRKGMLPVSIDHEEELRTLHITPENHPHVNDPMASASMDRGFYAPDSGSLGMPVTYNPVRFSGRSQAKGRASDLDTLNTVEWSQYVNTHFSPGRDSALVDGGKTELMRVEEEGGIPHVPASSGHPPNANLLPLPPPEVQTVKQEDFTMVNSPNNFDWNDRSHRGDERLELMALPIHKNQSRDSGWSHDEASSLRDEEDYSRRILKVSNPDVEEQKTQNEA